MARTDLTGDFDLDLDLDLDGTERDSRRTFSGQDSWQHLSFDWQEGVSTRDGGVRGRGGSGETGQLAERNPSERSGWNEAEALNASLSAWINKARDTWRHYYLRSVHRPPIPSTQSARKAPAKPPTPAHGQHMLTSWWTKSQTAQKLTL